MKKYLILSALLLGLLGDVFAQDGGFAPAAGDFSGAVLFGRGSYQTYGLDIPSVAGTSTGWNVSGSAPYLNAVEPNSNDVSNMFAVEGRYFITNTIALKMSGGAILRGHLRVQTYLAIQAPLFLMLHGFLIIMRLSRAKRLMLF
ncbi:MAG: hypothetical protein IPN68_14570 [Bacteroidetes bacterium]|nr:hypothetical protein [Bacteroidota bacterium]